MENVPSPHGKGRVGRWLAGNPVGLCGYIVRASHDQAAGRLTGGQTDEWLGGLVASLTRQPDGWAVSRGCHTNKLHDMC